jgi:hypothetical protein
MNCKPRRGLFPIYLTRTERPRNGHLVHPILQIHPPGLDGEYEAGVQTFRPVGVTAATAVGFVIVTFNTAAVWVDADKPHTVVTGDAHASDLREVVIAVSAAPHLRRQNYIPDLGARLVSHVAQQEAAAVPNAA